MLYRYLRDYTPSSPMNSPLDAVPYDFDPDEEIIDSQPWWGDQPAQQIQRDSSPSVDLMDTSNPSTRGHSVPPVSIPDPPNRRPSTTSSLNGSEAILGSPSTGSMAPPPLIPQLARMKRKGSATIELADLKRLVSMV